MIFTLSLIASSLLLYESKEKLDCVYLHFQYDMSPSAVWIMYIKSCSLGSGTKMLKMLCKLADQKEVCILNQLLIKKGV